MVLTWQLTGTEREREREREREARKATIGTTVKPPEL